VTVSIFNSSTSSTISVCLLLLGICSQDGLGCQGVTKVAVDHGKFVLLSLCGDLIVETELDLGDRSEWIRVERDLALCELHNRDVGIFC
jgi:hypothetical protein